jgi:hypothetical protein
MRRARGIGTILLLGGLLGWSGSAEAAFRQVQVTHIGDCGQGQGTLHNLTIWTNDTGQTVTNVATRIFSSGTGIQGYLTARASDGYTTAFAGHQNPVGVSTSEQSPMYDKPVPFGPGDHLAFIHWCYPPDTYYFIILFEYAVNP